MVYDPSAKSRSASGVFPLGFPFTSTSASAGVDRTRTLPVCVRRTAPDAGREGLGAIGALGAGLPAVAPGAFGALGAGRSTTVESTPGCLSATGVGSGDRRNNPTDNAATIAKTTNTATICQRRLRGSRSTSLVSTACGGCTDQEEGKTGGGGAGPGAAAPAGGPVGPG